MTVPLPTLCHEAIVAGRVDEADALIGRMLAEKTVNPAHVLELRVALLVKIRAYNEALKVIDDLLRLGVAYYGTWFNRGQVLHWLGRFDEAIASYRTALSYDWNNHLAWMRMGHVNLVLDRWPESLACYERSLALKPGDWEIHMAYACWMQMHDQDADAEAQYRTALMLARGAGWEQAPAAIEEVAFEAEAGLGFVLLRQGKWDEGWRRFEARWRMHPHGAPWDFSRPPPWMGKPGDLDGKRVLLHAEQGFGDTIHFARYAAMVAERASVTYLTAQPPIRRLLATLDVVRDGRVVVEGQDMPEPEITVSLMSLPAVFGTLPDNVPPPAKFLIKPRKIRPRIGVCWHGGSRPEDPLAHDDDQRRSIPWDVFHPIVEAANGGGEDCVISLQEDDLREWGCEDWTDTAAIVAGLDLVITVDTAMAHLAASLGVETWMFARMGGCWRWGASGERTPWYPSMTIIRQKRHGDWHGPVAEVVRMLGGTGMIDEIRWPLHKAGLHIDHNLHRNYHETIAQALDRDGGYPTYDRDGFPDEAEIEKCIATDSVWTIQWYPDTPNGFYRVHAATLDRALEHAMKTDRERG